MNFFDKINKIKQTCNYNFSSFRDVIFSLERVGRRNGLSNPVAQIVISATEKNDIYNATISLYYMMEGNDVQTLSKEMTIYSFDNIPEYICSLIKKDGSAKILFSHDDVQDLLADKDLLVYKKDEPLTKLIASSLSEINDRTKRDIKVQITDCVLYHRVIVYVLINQEEKYISEFLTTSIIGVSVDKIKVLRENHEISLAYKL